MCGVLESRRTSSKWSQMTDVDPFNDIWGLRSNYGRKINDNVILITDCMVLGDSSNQHSFYIMYSVSHKTTLDQYQRNVFVVSRAGPTQKGFPS